MFNTDLHHTVALSSTINVKRKNSKEFTGRSNRTGHVGHTTGTTTGDLQSSPPTTCIVGFTRPTSRKTDMRVWKNIKVSSSIYYGPSLLFVSCLSLILIYVYFVFRLLWLADRNLTEQGRCLLKGWGWSSCSTYRFLSFCFHCWK